MDVKKFLRFLRPAVAGLVAVSRAENPGYTEDQIARDVEGDLKHMTRLRLGFIADLLWFSQDFRVGVRQVIREEMAPAAEGQEDAE